MLAILRPQLPTSKSTQVILDRTAPSHDRTIDRADRLLAVIEDFKAMDQRVVRRSR